MLPICTGLNRQTQDLIEALEAAQKVAADLLPTLSVEVKQNIVGGLVVLSEAPAELQSVANKRGLLQSHVRKTPSELFDLLLGQLLVAD